MRRRRRATLLGFVLAMVLTGAVHAATIVGGSSRDVIRGTAKADELYGFAGGDHVVGGRGADTLIGGRGHDLLEGGPGNDVLLGGRGRDKLVGGTGRDSLMGGPGADLVISKNGARDFVDCGLGKDQIIRDPFDHIENCEKRKVKAPAGGYGGTGGAGSGGSGGSSPPPPPPPASAPSANGSRLTVRADAGGTVTSTPAGIACPGRCTANFAAGARVSLRATPTRNRSFTKWAGSCSGTQSTCSLRLGRDRWVRAMFGGGGASPPPPPPPPPGPPPPPPPSGSGCTTANYSSWSWSQCQVGTTIAVTNGGWHCSRPLSSYGALPIKVISSSTTAWDDAGAVTVDSGCTGPSVVDTAVHLIVDIRGDGPRSSAGPGQDAFKTRGNPQNLNITGSINCGRRAPGAHQDSVQIQGGTNITLVNVEAGGNYDAGTSTCMGAGGGPFYSLNRIANVDILGGKYISCNHALNGNNASSGPGNGVYGARFRSGRLADPNCAGFAGSSPCINTGPLTIQNITCEQWLAGRWAAVPPT